MELQVSEMCDFPFYVKNPRYPIWSNETQIPVPCGKCPHCQARRASNWTFRLQKEDEVSKSSLFVTLTYNTDHVPISERGYMTLNKHDVQKYIKRLRKCEAILGNRRRLRYYLAGEYGSQTFRPHYHIILFDVSDPNSVSEAWKLDGKPIGDVHIGNVTGASVGYTCKYINKGKIIPLHANDDRIPEFSLMSKKMGSSYLTPEMIQFHKNDPLRCYISLPDGNKISLPRYYRDKIYTEKEKLIQAEHVATMQDKQHQERKREFEKQFPNSDFEKSQYDNKVNQLKKHRAHGLKSRDKI